MEGQGKERWQRRGRRGEGHGEKISRTPPPPRREDVCQETTERGEETDPAAEEEEMEGGDMDG